MTLDHNNTKKPSEQELLKQLAELNNKIAQTSAASAISLPSFTLPPLSSLPSSSSTTSSTTARTSLSSATTPTFDDKSSTTTTTRTGITNNNNNKNNIHEKKRKRTIEESKAIAIKNDGNNVNQPKKRMKFLPPQLLNKTTTATTTTTSSATSTTIKAQPTNSIQIQQLQKYDYHLLQQANLVKQRKSLEAAHTTTTTTTGTPSTTTTTTLLSQQQQQQHSNKKHQLRSAAGETWEDNTLLDYPENDYRLFVGNLGNDVTDDVLAKSFSVFPSFTMARVIRDKKTLKSRGYGFVSMMDVNDYITALDKMNGKYIGSRPCEIKKSNWRDRSQHK